MSVSFTSRALPVTASWRAAARDSTMRGAWEGSIMFGLLRNLLALVGLAVHSAVATIAEGADLHGIELTAFDLIIDALLGTGFEGPVRGVIGVASSTSWRMNGTSSDAGILSSAACLSMRRAAS